MNRLTLSFDYISVNAVLYVGVCSSTQTAGKTVPSIISENHCQTLITGETATGAANPMLTVRIASDYRANVVFVRNHLHTRSSVIECFANMRSLALMQANSCIGNVRSEEGKMRAKIMETHHFPDRHLPIYL